jgi:hypothetical protein
MSPAPAFDAIANASTAALKVNRRITLLSEIAAAGGCWQVVACLAASRPPVRAGHGMLSVRHGWPCWLWEALAVGLGYLFVFHEFSPLKQIPLIGLLE